MAGATVAKGPRVESVWGGCSEIAKVSVSGPGGVVGWWHWNGFFVGFSGVTAVTALVSGGCDSGGRHFERLEWTKGQKTIERRLC